jgi:predicted ATP-dependent serine protease
VSMKDPLRPKLEEIKKHLMQYQAKKGDFKITFGEQELRGLKKSSNSVKSGKLATINPNGMSAEEMMKVTYKSAGLIGKWRKWLGNAAKGFVMLLHGKQGQGKSTLALKFAREEAKRGERVLYVSSEEYGAPTLQLRLERLGGPVKNLDFVENIEKTNLKNYDLVVIDSAQDSGMSEIDIKPFKNAFPELNKVIILQSTKDGKYKGGSGWGHAVDIEASVESGKAETRKNRYAELSEMDVW